MKYKSKTALVLLVALLMLVTGCHCATEKPGTTESVSTGGGIEVNGLAPDFTLINLEGETITLSQFKGYPVMLNL